MPCSRHRRTCKKDIKHSNDICPRCTRNIKFCNSGKSPKLLTYYKNLCKSSKCLIHKRQLRKTKQKPTVLKKKKLNSLNFSPVNSLEHSSYIIDEFEEEKDTVDDIEFSMFKKIDSTIEDLDTTESFNFSNLAGYKIIKEIINKTIIWPLKKPETFRGLRTAPKGVLLFGPPGTGKTFLGKLIASETGWTFFNVPSSVLTSKWMGENEKLVRTMFIVAKAREPSIIFIDEIDSILSKSVQDDSGCLRRLKNEFLVCMGESGITNEDKIMVMGATNRPYELDDGVRHKFSKRLYIPLPDASDRKDILLKLLESECHSLEDLDICSIVAQTEGYSVVDLKHVCQEAAMGPIKALTGSAIDLLKPNKIRPISLEDFLWALQLIKPTVSIEQVKVYEEWDSLYGYGGESSTIKN